MAIKILRQIVDATGRWMRVGPRTVILQSSTDDKAGVWGVADEADGAQHVKPVASVAGGTASPVVGVSGRLPKDVTIQINAVGPKSVVVHPLRGGVSVIGANGAAAAVSASGKVVTLTAKNDGTTTVTAMNALIAASATVSPLVGALSGTGADTFEAAFAVAETPLWAAGTIPASAMVALGEDGYWWPAQMDTTSGAIHTYQRGVSTATDAQRTEPVTPPPRGVNGPATIVDLSGAAIADGTYTYPFAFANYGYVSISALWTNNDAGERGRLDIEARIDDSTATPNWRNVNSKFAVGTGASPGGVADTALAALAQNGALLAECTEPQKAWRELRAIYTKSASVAGNDTLRIVYFVAR